MNLLSNGSYNVLLSNMGGGYSSWRDVDLTRWQPDGVLDSWGNWIYIRDLSPDPQAQNRPLSGPQPTSRFPATRPICRSASLPIWPSSAVPKIPSSPIWKSPSAPTIRLKSAAST
ncbi:MAG: hypothetical protein AB9907_06085 [Flexilinea sp.]